MVLQDVTDFFNWWHQQLLSLLPSRIVTLCNKKTLFIVYDGTHYTCYQPVQNGRQLPPKNQIIQLRNSSVCSNHLNEILSSIAKTFANCNLVLALSHKASFTRQFKVPQKAAAKGQAILDQDLARLSPASDGELIAGWHIEKNELGSHLGDQMHQYMVRKEIVEQVIAPLHRLGQHLTKCSVVQQDRVIAPINLLQGWYTPPQTLLTKLKVATKWLAFISCGLLAFLAWQKLDRQKQVIEQLQIQVKVQKKQAQLVLNQISDIRKNNATSLSLYNQKNISNPSVLIWEELSKTFPDSAWLLQFDINGQSVKISGFAKSAAELIERIEASTYFYQAAFLSPVVAGIGNGLERFTITFRLANAKPSSTVNP